MLISSLCDKRVEIEGIARRHLQSRKSKKSEASICTNNYGKVKVMTSVRGDGRSVPSLLKSCLFPIPAGLLILFIGYGVAGLVIQDREDVGDFLAHLRGSHDEVRSNAPVQINQTFSVKNEVMSYNCAVPNELWEYRSHFLSQVNQSGNCVKCSRLGV